MGETLRGHPHALTAGASLLLDEDGLHEFGQIGEALAQRGQAEREDGQAIVEILAEPPLRDGLRQIDVGRGDDADVDSHRAVGSHGLEASFLKHAKELGLKFDGKFAHLVEEQRPAVRHLEPAGAVLQGSREGALHVAEEFALEKALGNGRAIDGDERAFGPLAPRVDGVSEAFLARAGLAEDQHRRLRLGHLARASHHVAHRRSLRALDRGGGVAFPIAFHQAGALALRGVKAGKSLALLGVLNGEPENLAVDIDEIDGLARIGLTDVAVEGHDPEAVLARAQGHHHARVAVREVEKAIEGITLAVRVIGFEERAGPPRVESLADGRELREVEGEVLHSRVGERSARHAGDELAVVENEDHAEVVLDDAREGVEPAAQDVIKRRAIRGEIDEVSQVAGQVQTFGHGQGF